MVGRLWFITRTSSRIASWSFGSARYAGISMPIVESMLITTMTRATVPHPCPGYLPALRQVATQTKTPYAAASSPKPCTSATPKSFMTMLA